MELKDKVTIITGAAGGIGKTTSEEFAKAGAKLVLVDYNKKALKKLAKEIRQTHVDVIEIQADVSNEQEVKKAVYNALGKFNKIDILINNAGICKMIPILEISADEWDHFMAVNLKSVFLFSKEVFRYMKEVKYGKIINIGSAAGKIGGSAAGAHYSASKAAVMCFTKSLALQAAPFKINVNCVCPGPTKTDITLAWGDKTNIEFAEKIPFKEYAESIDIANAILFLASDKSKYITGEILDVNGGLVMD